MRYSLWYNLQISMFSQYNW